MLLRESTVCIVASESMPCDTPVVTSQGNLSYCLFRQYTYTYVYVRSALVNTHQQHKPWMSRLNRTFSGLKPQFVSGLDPSLRHARDSVSRSLSPDRTFEFTFLQRVYPAAILCVISLRQISSAVALPEGYIGVGGNSNAGNFFAKLVFAKH